MFALFPRVKWRYITIIFYTSIHHQSVSSTHLLHTTDLDILFLWVVVGPQSSPAFSPLTYVNMLNWKLHCQSTDHQRAQIDFSWFDNKFLLKSYGPCISSRQIQERRRECTERCRKETPGRVFQMCWNLKHDRYLNCFLNKTQAEK